MFSMRFPLHSLTSTKFQNGTGQDFILISFPFQYLASSMTPIKDQDLAVFMNPQHHLSSLSLVSLVLPLHKESRASIAYLLSTFYFPVLSLYYIEGASDRNHASLWKSEFSRSDCAGQLFVNLTQMRTPSHSFLGRGNLS